MTRGVVKLRVTGRGSGLPGRARPGGDAGAGGHHLALKGERDRLQLGVDAQLDEDVLHVGADGVERACGSISSAIRRLDQPLASRPRISRSRPDRVRPADRRWGRGPAGRPARPWRRRCPCPRRACGWPPATCRLDASLARKPSAPAASASPITLGGCRPTVPAPRCRARMLRRPARWWSGRDLAWASSSSTVGLPCLAAVSRSPGGRRAPPRGRPDRPGRPASLRGPRRRPDGHPPEPNRSCSSRYGFPPARLSRFGPFCDRHVRRRRGRRKRYGRQLARDRPVIGT